MPRHLLKDSVQSRYLPLWTLLTAIVFVAIMAGLVLFVDLNDKTTPLVISIIGFIASTVPSMLAAGFSERTSNDIRNGVIVEKTKQGTKEALAESGVVDTIPNLRRPPRGWRPPNG